jgi:hypothetical protein
MGEEETLDVYQAKATGLLWRPVNPPSPQTLALVFRLVLTRRIFPAVCVRDVWHYADTQVLADPYHPAMGNVLPPHRHLRVQEYVEPPNLIQLSTIL